MENWNEEEQTIRIEFYIRPYGKDMWAATSADSMVHWGYGYTPAEAIENYIENEREDLQRDNPFDDAVDAEPAPEIINDPSRYDGTLL